MNTSHSLILIFVMALVTALLRFLPFLLFPAGAKRPGFVLYLNRVLPPAAIAMLVVYCLKDTHFMSLSGFLPAAISIVVVILLHIWKKQPLLSIGAGTICYMILLQQVF